MWKINGKTSSEFQLSLEVKHLDFAFFFFLLEVQVLYLVVMAKPLFQVSTAGIRMFQTSLDSGAPSGSRGREVKCFSPFHGGVQHQNKKYFRPPGVQVPWRVPHFGIAQDPVPCGPYLGSSLGYFFHSIYYLEITKTDPLLI